MSAAGHTPGPWRYGQNSAQKADGTQWEIGIGDPIGGISDIGGVRGGDYMLVGGVCREADARLIAAAPDLLAALERVEKLWRACVFDDGSVYDAASREVSAAIAKARGE